MAFVMVTVTGQYLLENGSPAAGTVEFLLTAVIQDAAASQMRSPVPVRVTLDSTGSFSTSLVSTTSAGIQPAGVSYQVTERVTGAPVRIFNVVLPASGTADMASLAPAVVGTPAYAYALDSDVIPLSQKGAPSGVATLDSGGKVPLSQLPPSDAAAIGAAAAIAIALGG